MSEETVTLLIAVAGLALAVASLVWQAATFFLGGPRVRVELRSGALGNSGVVVGPVKAGMAEDRLIQEGFTEPILGIEVINNGRMPTSVNAWHASFENGMQYTDPAWPISPDLPYRLEAHSSASWFVRMQPLQAAVYASHASGVGGAQQKVWMSAGLANGKTLRTKESIVIKA